MIISNNENQLKVFNDPFLLFQMPGHVKRGGTGDPDPDPSPFLLVSYEDHQKDLAKVV